MKKLAILVVVAMSVSFANAQKVSEKEVPATVKSALQSQYSAAKKIKWEKEEGNYEAGFEINKADYSLLINAAGNIIETEVAISVEALPANVKGYISKNYAGQKIKEAAKITDAQGMVTYEAEVKGKDLIFDSNGNFIKEVKG